MQQSSGLYKPETVGTIMSTVVPTCRLKDSLSEVFGSLTTKKYDSIHNIYVVGGNHELLGIVDVTELTYEDDETLVEDIYKKTPTTLNPHSDQERAVYYAIKEDIVAIPVVDKQGKFLGAVTSRALIDVMHEEHIEDALITAGIRSEGLMNLSLLSSRVSLLVKSRAPWLVIGLMAGLMLGFISSWFEESLQQSIAIAYFIPVVAYVAGSVGAQAGAIAVRTLALMKFDYKRYLYKEFFTGIFLGLIVGTVGFFGALLIASNVSIAFAVALSLVVASTLASSLASLIPLVFKMAGKDPALGSGPIATALLDVASVLSYFLIATLLV